jgi:EAL domain-containing protein (putative c-di-GMP-specific phosphodiesterase class I)
MQVGIDPQQARLKLLEAAIERLSPGLYRASLDNRETFRFFDRSMEEALRERHRLADDLGNALGLGQLRLVYQPLVNLRRGAICCFEALVRWDHPVHGAVPPDIFIPIAEAAGLIGDIGAWVLRQACEVAARWPAGISVAVNLSPLQVTSRSLAADVATALSASGLPGNRLELEITESAQLVESELSVGMLQEIRSMGVRLSVDDFGTGYSSLKCLRNFPFDKIKIDKTFVAELGFNVESAVIVESVVELARRLGLTTTAEGIETAEQLETIHALGCTEGQGDLFSRPVAAEDASMLLPWGRGDEMPADETRFMRMPWGAMAGDNSEIKARNNRSVDLNAEGGRGGAEAPGGLRPAVRPAGEGDGIFAAGDGVGAA